MTSSKTNNKTQPLDAILEFAQEIDRKMQEFSSDSEKTAEKWQKRAESDVIDE